jgi:hypothetical protein
VVREGFECVAFLHLGSQEQCSVADELQVVLTYWSLLADVGIDIVAGEGVGLSCEVVLLSRTHQPVVKALPDNKQLTARMSSFIGVPLRKYPSTK